MCPKFASRWDGGDPLENTEEAMKPEGYCRGHIFTSLVILMLVAGTAFAQTTAGIIGTVTDDTGAVVPQTAVTITNVGTGQ